VTPYEWWITSCLLGGRYVRLGTDFDSSKPITSILPQDRYLHSQLPLYFTCTFGFFGVGKNCHRAAVRHKFRSSCHMLLTARIEDWLVASPILFLSCVRVGKHPLHICSQQCRSGKEYPGPPFPPPPPPGRVLSCHASWGVEVCLSSLDRKDTVIAFPTHV
jgi:hypothetical protein